MKEMQPHLDKLRDDAAECAMRAAETTDKEQRDRLATASQHLTSLADRVEQAMTREAGSQCTDLTAIQNRLFDAERRVAEGAERIAKQETTVATPDRDGRNTIEASKLLAALKQAQALHIESRDRALADLSRARSRG